MQLNKLRVIGAIKDRLLTGPEVIYLDISYSCNLNCVYCQTHTYLNKEPTFHKPLHLQLIDIKKIISDPIVSYCKYIAITGFGEPTLHPEFKKIIYSIARKNLRIALYTNATFNMDLLPVIYKINSVCVNFSIPDEKLYNKLISPRNKNMYVKVMKNMGILGALNKKYKRPSFTLSFIINAINYKFIVPTMKLAKELGASEIYFSFMMPTKYTKELMLSREQGIELLKIIDEILKNNYFLRHNLEEIKTETLNYTQKKYILPNQCFAGWFHLTICHNKDVTFCCCNKNLIIGNLEDNSIENIWQSEKAHKIRLMCKYEFNISKYPFKRECEWCQIYKEYNKKITAFLEKQNV